MQHIHKAHSSALTGLLLLAHHDHCCPVIMVFMRDRTTIPAGISGTAKSSGRMGSDLLNRGQEATSGFYPAFSMKPVLPPAFLSASCMDSRNNEVTHSKLEQQWGEQCLGTLLVPSQHTYITPLGEPRAQRTPPESGD